MRPQVVHSVKELSIHVASHLGTLMPFYERTGSFHVKYDRQLIPAMYVRTGCIQLGRQEQVFFQQTVSTARQSPSFIGWAAQVYTFH
jgi:hypothetical protein